MNYSIEKHVKGFLQSDQNFIEDSKFRQTVIKKLKLNVEEVLIHASKLVATGNFNSMTSVIYEVTEDYMYDIYKNKMLKGKMKSEDHILYMAWIWTLTNILIDYLDYTGDLSEVDMPSEETCCETEGYDMPSEETCYKDWRKNWLINWGTYGIWNKLNERLKPMDTDSWFTITIEIDDDEDEEEDRLNSWLSYANKHYTPDKDLNDVRKAWQKTL